MVEGEGGGEVEGGGEAEVEAGEEVEAEEEEVEETNRVDLRVFVIPVDARLLRDLEELLLGLHHERAAQRVLLRSSDGERRDGEDDEAVHHGEVLVRVMGTLPMGDSGPP